MVDMNIEAGKINIISKELDTDEMKYVVLWEYNGRKGWSECYVTQEMIDDPDLDLEKQWFMPIIESWIEWAEENER
jgi:hypothetical protein